MEGFGIFDDRDIATAARSLVEKFTTRGLMLATAESCTGGLIAGAVTEIAGSSAVLDRGFVSYSNAAKTEMLGVPSALIEAHGAVSSEVARAMADGALRHSRADIAVAVTGIAGPGGGSPAKPVGLVYVAALRRGSAPAIEELRLGDIGRDAVRRATILRAVALACHQAD
ncbi:MAG: CinA family protein [Hyphomicrobiaceae bacterium]